MITRIRRWIARVVALLVTVLTLGRLSVDWGGVDPTTADTKERPAITSLESSSLED